MFPFIIFVNDEKRGRSKQMFVWFGQELQASLRSHVDIVKVSTC